jgi:Zn-dependent peptidase ImmA (M78 family)
MGLFVSKEYSTRDFFGNKLSVSAPGNIYILDHLPVDLVYWVLAHEYAHAWYKERVFEDRGLIISEGFAELIAYHVLMYKQLNNIAKCIMKHKGPYGQGARKLLDYEKTHGYSAMLQYVIKKTK